MTTTIVLDEAGAAEAPEGFWCRAREVPTFRVTMWVTGRPFPWCWDAVVWMPHICVMHEPGDGVRCAASGEKRCGGWSAGTPQR